jgi:hypothetical protein
MKKSELKEDETLVRKDEMPGVIRALSVKHYTYLHLQQSNVE